MTDRTWRMSAIKKFKRCPRSFWLTYGTGTGNGREKARDADKPASGQRDVGTLAHLGVQTGYLSTPANIPEVLGFEQRKLELAFGVEKLTKEWLKEFTMAELIAKGFFEWLEQEGSDANEETIHIEQRFTAHAGTYNGDDVYITGQPDRIYRDRVTGLYGMDDWKTVDSLLRPPHLDFDDQKLTYDWLLLMNGIDAATFRHTQLKKNMRTARAAPPFYARHPSTVSREQRESHRRHLGSTIRKMVEAVQAVESNLDSHHDYLEPTPTKDCGWDCDFKNVCPLMDQGDYWQTALDEWFQPRKDKH